MKALKISEKMPVILVRLYCYIFGHKISEHRENDTLYLGEASWLGDYDWYLCTHNCGYATSKLRHLKLSLVKPHDHISKR